MEKYLDKTLSAKERTLDLVDKMSLDEKMAQIIGFNPAKWGMESFDEYPFGVGQIGFFVALEKNNILEAVSFLNDLQKKNMKKSKHGIPAFIHVETLCGAMIPEATSFPIGISQASTFNTKLQEELAESIGNQVVSSGVSHCFAPVLDISRGSKIW